ncbi:hypothetical protein D3C76_883020 [compost metagenome]
MLLGRVRPVSHILLDGERPVRYDRRGCGVDVVLQGHTKLHHSVIRQLRIVPSVRRTKCDLLPCRSIESDEVFDHTAVQHLCCRQTIFNLREIRIDRFRLSDDKVRRWRIEVHYTGIRTVTSVVTGYGFVVKAVPVVAPQTKHHPVANEVIVHCRGRWIGCRDEVLIDKVTVIDIVDFDEVAVPFLVHAPPWEVEESVVCRKLLGVIQERRWLLLCRTPVQRPLNRPRRRIDEEDLHPDANHQMRLRGTEAMDEVRLATSAGRVRHP